MPYQFSDKLVLKDGCPWLPNWFDHELVNNKPGWETLGVINGNLISGFYQGCSGNDNLIPQTMAGVEIDVDSDEFQKWYRAYTTFPSQAISEAQYQIKESLINTLKVHIVPIGRSRVTSVALSAIET
jgi:hypothetical protein